MIEETLKKAEQRMEQSVDAARHDFQRLRTGRANPAMLERVMVDYYGTPTPVNQLATISVPEPRQLLIQPYDRSSIPMVEKAIQKSDLGINPITDAAGIRLMIPTMTEERRKELVKELHQRGEEGCVAVRNVRRDAHNELKQAERDHAISEDDFHRADKRLQDLTDKYIAMIHEAQTHKEQELMEV
jgi:ribosome recycling factor